MTTVNPTITSGSTNIRQGGSLTYTHNGPMMTAGSWCSNCNNGGRLVLCLICGIVSICTDCLDFDGKEDLFHCPSCFIRNSKLGKYPYTFRKVASSRQVWPKIITSPVAIISIHLEGMSNVPSHLIYYHLHDWLQGNIMHISLDFNFDDVPWNDFETRFNSVLDKFEQAEFQNWERFMVLITTHSDPTTGFLHIVPNNRGSVPVKEMLEVIFTDRFRAILSRGDKNILSLLSCGSLSSYPDSRIEIQKFANTNLFEKILCFAQADFQPSTAHKFFMDWALSHFIHERRSLSTFLMDHQTLGAHTDIIQFRFETTTTFRWTHPGIRPFGESGVTKQCPNGECNRLKTVTPMVSGNGMNIHLQCSECREEVTYTFPAGWAWVDGAPVKRGHGQGAWLVRTESH